MTLIDKPHGSIRWKYWAAVGTPMLAVFLFAIQKREPLSYFYLSLFSGISVALAILMCREMWTLRARHTPRWIGLLLGFASTALILALLVLHDLGMFMWNHLYFEIPFIIFFVLTGLCAWISEARKSVRIYVDIEGTKFVSTV